jgi:hypothetical protein
MADRQASRGSEGDPNRISPFERPRNPIPSKLRLRKKKIVLQPEEFCLDTVNFKQLQEVFPTHPDTNALRAPGAAVPRGALVTESNSRFIFS